MSVFSTTNSSYALRVHWIVCKQNPCVCDVCAGRSESRKIQIFTHNIAYKTVRGQKLQRVPVMFCY